MARCIRQADVIDAPNLPGEAMTTVTLAAVSCGTELAVVQEGLPTATPLEADIPGGGASVTASRSRALAVGSTECAAGGGTIASAAGAHAAQPPAPPSAGKWEASGRQLGGKSMDPRQWLVVLGCACLLGCTTLQTVQVTQESASAGATQLTAGDRVGVRLKSGDRVDLRVLKADAQALEGENTATRNSVRFPWSEVDAIEQARFDGGRTAMVVGAVLLGALVLGMAAARSVAANFSAR
jgi:hypothetical protein